MNDLLLRIYRIGKILKGIDKPYWKNDTEVIQYSPVAIIFLKKRQQELIEELRGEHVN